MGAGISLRPSGSPSSAGEQFWWRFGGGFRSRGVPGSSRESRTPYVIAFRIASRRHPVFDGAGAAEYGGRWHSPGRPVIYAATSLSLAMLEQLAQTGTGHLPTDHVCVEITIPDSIAIEIASASDIPGWDAPDRRASRAFGDRWLMELRTCVLRFASVIVPTERNVAINPAHVDFARIDASAPRPLNRDERLKKYVEGRRL